MDTLWDYKNQSDPHNLWDTWVNLLVRWVSGTISQPEPKSFYSLFYDQKAHCCQPEPKSFYSLFYDQKAHCWLLLANVNYVIPSLSFCIPEYAVWTFVISSHIEGVEKVAPL